MNKNKKNDVSFYQRIINNLWKNVEDEFLHSGLLAVSYPAASQSQPRSEDWIEIRGSIYLSGTDSRSAARFLYKFLLTWTRYCRGTRSTGWCWQPGRGPSGCAALALGGSSRHRRTDNQSIKQSIYQSINQLTNQIIDK